MILVYLELFSSRSMEINPALRECIGFQELVVQWIAQTWHDGTLVNHCILGECKLLERVNSASAVTPQGSLSLTFCLSLPVSLSPFPLPSIQWENFLPLILKESCHLLSLISVCTPELYALVERFHTCKHTLVHTHTHTQTHTTSLPLSCSQVKSYSVQLVEHEKKMSEMADLALAWVPSPSIALPCPALPRDNPSHREQQEFTPGAEDRGRERTEAAKRREFTPTEIREKTLNTTIHNQINIFYDVSTLFPLSAWFYCSVAS